MPDERTTISLVGGPCDGRTVEVDPKDASRTIVAAPYDDRAVALNAHTITDSDVMAAAYGHWERYVRTPDDPAIYAHVPDDLTYPDE